ncbi:MAG: hypothetical protein PHS96_03645 [Anaerolineales bacterium]|nr:hypothetical protein [Anaerolineales bacterium]
MKGNPVRLSHVTFFCVFMVVGFWFGRQTGGVARAHVEQALSMSQETAALDYPVPASGQSNRLSSGFGPSAEMGAQDKAIQRNVLLIGVDDLQAPQPSLNSVWMVMYLEGTNLYTFMPIFPSSEANSLNDGVAGNTLQDIFTLQPDGSPGIPFIATLRVRDLWWNGYVMVDTAGLVSLSEGLGGIDPQMVSNLTSRAQLVGQPALTTGSQAIIDQAHLINAICHRASTGLRPSQVVSVIETLHGRLNADFDLATLAGEWARLAQSDAGITCEFPTLINELNAH